MPTASDHSIVCPACRTKWVKSLLKYDFTFDEIWEPSTIISSNNNAIEYRMQNQIEMKNIQYYDDTAQAPISGFVYTSIALQYLKYF